MDDELYDLSYTLLCIQGVWRKAHTRECKEAAMRMAHKEVSAKPGLRNMLPGRAKDFLNNPVAQSDSRPASPQNVSPKKASFEHVNPKHASLQPLPLPADPYSVFPEPKKHLLEPDVQQTPFAGTRLAIFRGKHVVSRGRPVDHGSRLPLQTQPPRDAAS